MDDYDRRTFIKTTLPGFLGLTLSLPAITAFATKANAFQGRIRNNAPINWDAFLEEVGKVAAKQHLDNWNEEGYIKEVIALSKRLNLKDPVLQAGFKKCLRGINNRRVDFNTLEQTRDFAVCLLDFQKGEKIPAHDHPGMTGVIQCASGAIQVENYDLIKKREGHNTVILNHSASLLMKKGMVGSLTSKARNIHSLVAQKPTQLVDVFAPPYDPQRSAKSSWFDIDTDPFEGKKGTFEAALR